MTLHLTTHEITIILQALAARPYNEVAEIVRKIKAQFVPANCRECEYDITCKAFHYKGDKCKYKKEE